MLKQFLEVGKVVGTHGINGEVRVECWCDSPDFLSKFTTLYFDKGAVSLSVKSRPHKNIALVKIKGVDTIEQAEVYRNKVLYINREDAKLPKGRYFVSDIIGMKVVNLDTNEVIGEITDVLKTGSNDVYEMKRASGEKIYIPVIDDIVKERDFEKGEIYIKPMKGLLDDED
ncbi:MAG: 16S rRNA processing protein RimM [Oscillospiraceae bacterium]|nr:16S rRNA processing protein RimM [Candidatus Ruminococcus equi]